MAIVKTQYDYWKEAHDQVIKEMAAMRVNYTLEDTIPNKYFKYIIDIPNMIDFHNVRGWLSTTYGFTEDISKDTPDVNKHWAFSINWRRHKLYLKGDDELSWFKIKYGDDR